MNFSPDVYLSMTEWIVVSIKIDDLVNRVNNTPFKIVKQCFGLKMHGTWTSLEKDNFFSKAQC